jgi:tetratricopeptide (TPR) repeat protein
MMRLSSDFRLTRRITSGVAFLFLLCHLVGLATAGDEVPKHATGASTPSGLVVGTEVVLKVSDTPLFDQGRLISNQDNLAFLIERVEEDRVLVASRDNSVRGWLIHEQVVPLDQAIGYFTRALDNDPRNTDHLWQRGRICFHLNDDDRALANLNMAIRLEPDQGRFYVTRGMIQLHRQQPDRTIEDCDMAIRLVPDASWAHVIRAIAWIAKNEPQRARLDLDHALRLDPTNPSGRANGSRNVVNAKDAGHGSKLLGMSARFGPSNANSQDEPGTSRPSGEPGQAKARADESDPSPRDPKNLGDLVASGNAWLAKRDYDKALAAFNEAIRLDPKYAPAFAARAQTWARKHYREREVADISTAINLDPNNAAYRVARGECWSAQGHHLRAMEDYDEAIRMDPNDPAKWLVRGHEWRKHLKLDQAIADYTQALQLNPRYAAAYIARAQTWKQRSAYDQAIREYSVLIQIDPNNSVGHWSLARILATCIVEQFRDGKRAVDEATRACELTRWHDPDCLDTLAAAAAESGDFQAAVKWQTQAIRLIRQNVPSALLQAQDVAGRRGIGFDDRLAFYRSKKPTRE